MPVPVDSVISTVVAAETGISNVPSDLGLIVLPFTLTSIDIVGESVIVNDVPLIAVIPAVDHLLFEPAASVDTLISYALTPSPSVKVTSYVYGSCLRYALSLSPFSMINVTYVSLSRVNGNFTPFLNTAKIDDP